MTFLEGLLPDYSTGEAAGDFIKKVADGAADFVCGLYRDYPGAIVDTSRSPAKEFGTGMMDSLCGKRKPGLPPPPDPTFSGGQCECVSYSVVLRLTNYSTAGVPSTSTSTGTFPGKIRGMQKLGRPNDPGFADWKILAGGAACPSNVLTHSRISNSATVTIQSATRVDGLADTCGQPPVGYPPVPIPSDRGSGTVKVDKDDGTSITLPIVLVGINASANFSPTINLNLGGIDLTIDVGGITIEDGTNGGNGNNGSPTTPDYQPSLDNLSDKLDDLASDLEGVKNDLDKLSKDFDDSSRNDPGATENDPDEKVPEEREEDDPKQEEGLERLDSVCVHLTTIPSNARRQFGDDAPDVIYAGWFEFRTGECFHPRQPIHFSNSFFKAPKGADGFAYTLYEGFRGRVTVTRIKAEATSS